ncbi:hypothetical protein KC19_4G238100 [Ceratodon purpureus]|uniref:N-acetyltransferase domain-containing protein n=1 Tax=Ceratodon purpureus TaxID=3225 RepID=A0A8T0IEG2_CERPU|nr:hypothetical protein KC19_4G238100 [Ceratodon purpureus]
MYSVAQTSVGVWGVDAHRVPCCSSGETKTCRPKDKRKGLDVRFRVSPHVCSNHIRVESVRDRKELQSGFRIWDSFGQIPERSMCCNQVLSTKLRRSVSVAPRAQASGEVAESVREDPLEESVSSSGLLEEDEVEDGVVAVGYGWKVREAGKFDVEELRDVAHVQASSFHIEAAVFDDLFFKLFKAEVLSALLYKAKHSPSDRYACLLAEPAILVDERELDDVESTPSIVGAVNLAASVDNDVLRHLQNADEYLYVSGMAVDINHRRQNVATLLLRACELLAVKWGFDYLVLHAYEDDMAARTLYSRGGYRVIALDPLWMSTWVGRKRRVLMAKKTSRTSDSDLNG